MLQKTLLLVSVIVAGVRGLLFSDFTRSPFLTTNAGVDTMRYVPSSRGTNPVEGSYAIRPRAEIYLEYSISFDKNFEWVKGGKLPGLRGGAKGVKSVGCVIPQPPNAWSFRLMWRRNARISMYMYDQDRIALGSACGISRESNDGLLTREHWHRFKIYMKVNSAPNKKDGIARLYVNDTLILERTGIPWRGSDNNTLINNIYFSTFYGGHDSSWAPKKQTYVRFKNVTFY